MYIPIISEIEFEKAQKEAKREKGFLDKKKDSDVLILDKNKTVALIKAEAIYKEKLEKIRNETKWKMDMLYKAEKEMSKRQEKAKIIQESEKSQTKLAKSDYEKAKSIISSNYQRDKNNNEINYKREVEYIRRKYQSKFGVYRKIVL